MKAMIFSSNYDVPDSSVPRLTIAPDSSLQHGDRPFFIPDIKRSFMIAVSAAFRISRVGKTIAPKFASRYVESVAPAVNFIDVEGLRRGEPEAYCTAFDGAVAVGEFVPVEKDTMDHFRFTVCIDGQERACWESSMMKRSVSEIISMASERFTLKTGDLILPGLYIPSGLEAKPDTRITAYSDGIQRLGFNIK